MTGVMGEIVVVDNNSTDDTKAIAKRFKRATILQQQDNLGFGIANNVGMSYAIGRDADFVFLLNQDAYLQPDTIKKLLGHMSFSDAALACPLQFNYEGTEINADMLKSYLVWQVPEIFSDIYFNRIKNTYRIHGTNAAAWFFRVISLKTLGGFDPLYFMYCEDDDLLYRLNHHGMHVDLVPSAIVCHAVKSNKSPSQRGWTAVSLRARRIRSELVVACKRPSVKFRWNLMDFIALGLVKPLEKFVRHPNMTELIAGWLAAALVLRELPRIRRHWKSCMTAGSHWIS